MVESVHRMRTCRTCGVEVEEGAGRCPLCGVQLGEGQPLPAAQQAAPVEPPVPVAKIRRWLWEVISLLGLTAAGIIFAIDVADGLGITWSLFPLSAVVFLWLVATSFIFLQGMPFALLPALALAALAFLFVLSLITSGKPWFLGLALPVVLLAAAVAGATWAAVRLPKLPVLPAIGVVVLGCGIATVGVEFILNRYLGLERVVGWSLVALACAISLFFALLLVHKRLAQRHADIRRFFHL